MTFNLYISQFLFKCITNYINKNLLFVVITLYFSKNFYLTLKFVWGGTFQLTAL